MATVRQKILRPILRDGLLTAEGDVWKRSRKAMAPVFTPRHIFGFAAPMLTRTHGLRRALRDDGPSPTSPRDMTHADLRHPGRDAVFRRDRGRARQLRPADRPPVRDDGPRRSARSVCARPTGCRASPASAAARPWPFSARSSPTRSAMRKRADGARRRRRAGGFPDAAAARRRPGRPDARGDRGQHHHLHRRRPRDHGPRARLDALLPRRSAVGARRDRGRDRRGAGARARPGEMARRHAAHPRRLRGGDAALSAGAVDQPRADRSRTLRGPRNRQGRAGAGHAVDGPPPPQALGRPGSLHARRASTRKTATRSTATSTCPSAPARASASAPPSPCRRRSSRSPS